MNSITKNELTGTLSFYQTAVEGLTDTFDQVDIGPGMNFSVLTSGECSMYLEILGALLDSGTFQIKGYDVSKQTGEIVLHTGEYSYSSLDYKAVIDLGQGTITKEVAADGKTLTLSLLSFEDYCAASDLDTEDRPSAYYAALSSIAYVVWRTARSINYSHHQAHLYEYIDDLERTIEDMRRAISKGVSGNLDLVDYLYSTTDWYVGLKSHQRRVSLADTYLSLLEDTFEDQD